MSRYTLGLDIGANSVGWALLETGDGPSVIDAGVRIFQEGVVNKDQGDREKSRNAQRREARGARRIHYRRNLRRDEILKTLKEAGMLPKDEGELEELFEKNPYELRAKGLDEKLTLYELARALFHLNQRRGFKSNRKSGDMKENSEIRQKASALQKDIDESGSRTLGEYLSRLDPNEERIRER